MFLSILTASALPTTIIVPDDYGTIQAAIDNAISTDIVMVRSGTYTENIDFLGKAITVISESGAEATVIDGNQTGSVVIFQTDEDPDSVLDGFTITNGNGFSAKVPRSNLRTAFFGGGIYCGENTSPTILNNIITENSLSVQSTDTSVGGGIYCGLNASPLIDNNIISNNLAKIGGGIYCYEYSTVQISNNTVSYNVGDHGSGGIHCCDYSVTTITGNNVIWNHGGDNGAGIGIYRFCAGTDISNNIIAYNEVNSNGAGIGCRRSGDITIENNIICNNRDPNSSGYGCGIYCYGGVNATIANNAIYNNVGGRYGAGIGCFGGNCIITNNTITGNRVFDMNDGKGGGIYLTDSNAVISNCILWNNYAPQGVEIALGKDTPHGTYTPAINYSNVRNGKGSLFENGQSIDWDDNTIISDDPLFFYLNNGELHLAVDSPCIDTGTDDPWIPYPSATDLDGNDRVLGAHVDMGCYEIKTSILVPGDYATIQLAINAAASDSRDNILVAPGTYVENIDFNGMPVTVMSSHGPADTIIDGSSNGSVITFSAGNNERSILSGFTITNGNGTSGSGVASLVGGGIYCETGSTQTICNNNIENNSSDAGGGLFCEPGSTTTIGLNNISQNGALSSHGAGVYIYICPYVCIADNRIFENSAANHGGAVFLHDSDIICNNNTIFTNDALGNGGGIYLQNSNPMLINQTITKNTAGVAGGGLSFDSTSSPTVKNTILWENSASSNPEVYGAPGASPVYSYCDIKDGAGFGTGCISEDPRFFNPLDDDYHITLDSPCFNAGDPDLADLPAADIDIQSRFFNTIDIGSDEIAIINVPEDYGTIQEAIDAAYFKDTVLVAEGTYQESIDFKGKGIYVESVYGFKSTVLEGSQAVSLVNFITDETSDSVLDGFTIINGGGSDGAGIYCYESSPTIINNLITDNTASDQGGGIYIEDSSPLLNSNLITYNSANTTGGAIYCYGSTLGLCSPKIINNTITGNSSSSGIGGIYGNVLADPTIANTILWDDSPSEIGGVTTNFTVTHCDIEGGFPTGSSIINADPQFIGDPNSAGSWKENDFHIEYNSPCQNSGTSSVSGLRKNDIDGNLITGDYDIGADEFDSYLYLTGNNHAGNTINIVNVSEGIELSYLLVGLNFLEEPIYVTNPPYDYEGWLYLNIIKVIIPGTTLFPPSGVIEEDHDLPNTPVDPYKIVIQSVIDDKLINYAVMFIGKRRISNSSTPLFAK